MASRRSSQIRFEMERGRRGWKVVDFRPKEFFPVKLMFWIGLVLVVLGLISLVVPIPHTEREGFSAGGMSVGVQTQYSERVSPIVSCTLILGGAVMMIAGRSAVRG